MTRRTKTEQLDPSTRGTRCIANKKDGTPCGAWAIRGGSCCRVHGGSAPQVRRKAQERILAAADPAAAKLVELMQHRDVPYNVQLAAAKSLLDRAGLSSAQEVVVGLRPYEEDMADILVDIELDPENDDAATSPGQLEWSQRRALPRGNS